MNLSEYISKNIVNSFEFKNIYNSLLVLYGKKHVMGSPVDMELDLEQACRFADILAKTSDDNSQTLALEMVVMLDDLYKGREIVEKTKSSVLSTTINFPGLKSINMPVFCESSLDSLGKDVIKEYLRVDSESDSYYFLSQKSIINQLEKYDVFSFSGPTSMGKSFVLRSYILKRMISSGNENYAYVVPTKALMNEIGQSMVQLITENKTKLKEKEYAVITSPTDLALSRKKCNYICVMTPESLLNILHRNTKLNFACVFIDEAHMLSTEQEERAALYYQIVEMLSSRQSNPKYIFASPYVPNPEVYNSIICDSINTCSYALKSSPVAQFRLWVDARKNKTKIFNRLLNKFVDCCASNGADQLETVNRIGSDGYNIVYCNSLENTMRLANEYASRYCGTAIASPELEAAAKMIEEEIHEECFLIDLLKKGVAYHVSFLPAKIRKVIEKLFREKKLHYMFCTSTIVEGVNLPADNIFVLSLNKGIAGLSEIELNNLMGRAGRISHSIVGNVYFIQDKESCCDISIDRWTIPDAQLGLDSFLQTENQGRIIINSLVNKDMSFKDIKVSRKREAIRYSSLLVDSICSDKNNRTRKSFSSYMNHGEAEIIKHNYEDSNDFVSYGCELCIAEPQLKNLEMKLKTEDIEYPSRIILESKQGWNAVNEFLRILSSCFLWEEYEKDLAVGAGEIPFYSTTLYNWLMGKPMKVIINGSLDYAKKHPQKGVWFKGHELHQYYDLRDDYHKNLVIGNTLDNLENLIKFRIANYLQCFSKEYAVVYGGREPQNDWSEFIEFGTMNENMIELQKLGFSRESAKFIEEDFDKYCLIQSGRILIREELLKKKNELLSEEILMIKANNPNRFI